MCRSVARSVTLSSVGRDKTASGYCRVYEPVIQTIFKDKICKGIICKNNILGTILISNIWVFFINDALATFVLENFVLENVHVRDGIVNKNLEFLV